MPIYVYRNLVTSETFEQEQRITDDALTVDPRTGDPVKRLIQPVGIAFKGSGFYVNDSRGSKNGGSKASSTTAASASDATGSGSKPSGEAGSSTTAGGAAASSTSSGGTSTAGSAGSGAATPSAG